jgi:hypothetical protein
MKVEGKRPTFSRPPQACSETVREQSSNEEKKGVAAEAPPTFQCRGDWRWRIDRGALSVFDAPWPIL